MALLFTHSNTDEFVDFGPSSSIDDWTAFTMLVWLYPTSLAGLDTLKRIFAKAHPTTANGKDFAHCYGFGAIYPQDCLRLRVNRATTIGERISNSGVVTTGSWQFYAGTYDESDGPRLWKGTLSTSVAELSYYTNNAGSGATLSDSDGSGSVLTALRIGMRSYGSNPTSRNYGAGGGFSGRIACIAYINKRLTSTELAYAQYNTANWKLFSNNTVFAHLGIHGSGVW